MFLSLVITCYHVKSCKLTYKLLSLESHPVDTWVIHLSKSTLGCMNGATHKRQVPLLSRSKLDPDCVASA